MQLLVNLLGFGGSSFDARFSLGQLLGKVGKFRFDCFDIASFRRAKCQQ